MKKLIYLFVMVSFVACGEKKSSPPVTEKNIKTNKNQVDTAKIKTSEFPKTISQIKSSYATTQLQLQHKKLDSVILRYNCQNERSGTISYYLKDGVIQLIKHAYAEYDHFEATNSYYLRDNQLYFVYIHQLNWSFESNATGKPGTKDDITESRIYFQEAKPTLYLEKKYTLHSSSPNQLNPERIPSRAIKPKSVVSLLATLEKLIAFKNNPKGGCLEK